MVQLLVLSILVYFSPFFTLQPLLWMYTLYVSAVINISGWNWNHSTLFIYFILFNCSNTVKDIYWSAPPGLQTLYRYIFLCWTSSATVCPYCRESVERILCDYPYHCEGNPSFWQLSLSRCGPYVQAMAASKPFCLGDRLGPINTNETRTRESSTASHRRATIHQPICSPLWNDLLFS